MPATEVKIRIHDNSFAIMNLKVMSQSLFSLQGAPGPVGASGLPGSSGNQVRGNQYRLYRNMVRVSIAEYIQMFLLFEDSSTQIE